MGEEKRTLSCTDCGVLNCHKRNASYPEFCLTEKLTDEDIAETTALYEDEENRKVSVISAEIEGEFYGKYTRVDEKSLNLQSEWGTRRLALQHVSV